MVPISTLRSPYKGNIQVNEEEMMILFEDNPSPIMMKISGYGKYKIKRE